MKAKKQKKVTATTNEITAEVKVNEHLDKTNPGDYAGLSLKQLGELLAAGDLNDFQILAVIKAIRNKAEAAEKTEKEKAEELVDRMKQGVIDYLSSFLSANGLELAKIKPLVAVTSEGKEKSSHTFFSVEKDFRVDELTARHLSFTLTVRDNISKAAQRALLKDAAFRIAMREAEKKKDAEIERIWNEFSDNVICSKSYLGEGPF